MIQITQVKPDEMSKVKELLSFTWKTTYGKFYRPEAIEKITTSLHDPKQLLQQANDKNTYFAVAKEGGKIIGLITVRKIDGEVAALGRIYVHPDQQGKGVGSQLMDAAFKYFPNIKRVKANCEKQNTDSCRFYQKKGFKKMSEKDEVVEGTKMTTVEFEKELP